MLHSRLPCGDVVWLRNSTFSYIRALNSMWGCSELWDSFVHTLEYLKRSTASVWMGPSNSPMGFLGEPGAFFTMLPWPETICRRPLARLVWKARGFNGTGADCFTLVDLSPTQFP